jgi:ribosomal protein L14E/L6E/L27E
VDERMLASAQSATKTVIARSKTVSEDEVAAAVQAAPQSRAADAPKSKATAKHKAAAKPSPADLEIDLNGMEFDD